MFRITIFGIIVLFSFNLNIHAQSTSSLSDIDNLVSQNKNVQALNLIDQKLIKKNNNLELLHLKALLLQRLNKINSAIKNYQLIIKLYPDFPDAYNNLAGIFAKQGNLDLAKNLLEKGMNTNKSYALLHKNIKNIYLEMARESYVKALRLGVKKHDVELVYSTIEQYNKNKDNTVFNKSSVSLSDQIKDKKDKKDKNSETKKTSKQTIQVTRTDPIIEKQTSAEYNSPRSTLYGPKKIIRRISKKKIVVAAWNEPVISIKDEVISALQGWAAAWSAQDVNLYLSFYNKQFLPENGIAKHIWVTQRKLRLLKPRWIEVKLSNFSIEQQTDDQAEVNVTQMYRSNSFRDKSNKKFLLQRSEDGWQILNEVNR